MKRTILSFGLALLSSLSVASAANYLGGSVSVKNGVGGLNLHYKTDLNPGAKIRYALNLDVLNVNSYGTALGGDVAYLADLALQGGKRGPLSPYYGAGLGAVVYLGKHASAVGLYPHGLIGVRYNISSPLDVFGEVNAGPAVVFGGASVGNVSAGSSHFQFGWGARVGINYRLK